MFQGMLISVTQLLNMKIINTYFVIIINNFDEKYTIFYIFLTFP